MKLYCIRHGETVYNAAKRIQGQTDSLLSELGRRQCQSVAEALGGLKFDAIYSSPLVRARDTAQYLADRLQLEVQLEPRLMEINAGIFQGHAWHELSERFPQDWARWRSQDPDFRIPNGESRRDVMHRAGAALRSIRETNAGQVIVVAHGGSLSAAFKELIGVPAERNPFELGNGSISILHWEQDVRMMTLNETGHLHGLLTGDGDL